MSVNTSPSFPAFSFTRTYAETNFVHSLGYCDCVNKYYLLILQKIEEISQSRKPPLYSEGSSFFSDKKTSQDILDDKERLKFGEITEFH